MFRLSVVRRVRSPRFLVFSSAVALIAVAHAVVPTLSSAQTADDGITLVGGETGSLFLDEGGAQPCEGNNFAEDNIVDCIMGGPMVGIEWVPAATVTIDRVEVYTGEHGGGNALGIWSDSGGTPSQPLASLAVTATFPIDEPLGWYGADLTAQLTVQAGTKYWVVWDPFNFGPQCSASDRPGDIQQTYWGSDSGDVSGGASWNGPFSSPDRRWKFRMFCTGGEVPAVSGIGTVLLLLAMLGTGVYFVRRRATS